MVLVKEDALKHSLEALMKVLQTEKNTLKLFLSFLRQKMERVEFQLEQRKIVLTPAALCS